MDHTSTPDPIRRPTRLSARSPEDFVAFTPLALGFVPDCSLVMLTFAEAGTSFHARVDLPEDSDDIDEAVETLLRPAGRHRVTGVVFLIYDDDTAIADDLAWSLRDAFVDDGIAVLDILRVWHGHWFGVLPGHPAAHYRGIPFDLSTHPFTARGVLDGRVTRASREELRASLDPVPERVEAVADLLAAAEPLPCGVLREVVMEHLAGRTTPSDADLAALLLAVAEPPGRDEAWSWLTREHAPGSVDLWSDVVRRSPPALVASPAAVLALAAWLAGEGALAWCAVDRCRAVDPDHTLADLVAGLLTSTTSPETWAALRPDEGEWSDPAA